MIASTKFMDVNIQSVEFNPVTSTAARVAILLEQRIINCEFIPGSRLVEKELVNVFKISRSPVLEALRLVANNGLATERAAERYDDYEKVTLRHKLDFLEAAHTDADPGAFFEANVVLTNPIHEAAKSITLVRLIRTIAKQGFRYRYLAY